MSFHAVSTCLPGAAGSFSAEPASASAAAARGFHDRGEERARRAVVADEFFGMPLHRDDEATAIRVLDRLDQVVGRPAHVSKVPTEPVDGLMVEAVDSQLGAADDR